VDAEYPELKSARGRTLAWLLRELGFPVHRIAALWDCNQGRVAEALASTTWMDK
jgi:hypothetical protein